MNWRVGPDSDLIELTLYCDFCETEQQIEAWTRGQAVEEVEFICCSCFKKNYQAPDYPEQEEEEEEHDPDS